MVICMGDEVDDCEQSEEKLNEIVKNASCQIQEETKKSEKLHPEINFFSSHQKC